MITITIDENILLDLLMNRVKYWTSDETIMDLYRDYYMGMIDSGCFEGCTVDIMSIVDNDYINNLAVISKEDFNQWNIEDKTDDKIVASNEDADLYLIRTY